jgi:alpha-N-arabinofuranosidase
MQGFAAHYYCGTAGTATQYSDEQWLELLAKAAAIDGLIRGHRQIMDEYDSDRRIKLFFDEWGAWHPVEEGKPKGGLYQQNTMRDACIAAITLNTFHNHADKVAMANIAQLINVLQSLLLVQDDKLVKTPTYHVFDLYKPHKGATAQRTIVATDTISDGGPSKETIKRLSLDKQNQLLSRIHASSSIKDGVLTVTIVNTHPTEPAEIELGAIGKSISDASIVTLSTPDIHDHNTFENPDKVKLSGQSTVSSSNGKVTLELGAASITRITSKIA